MFHQSIMLWFPAADTAVAAPMACAALSLLTMKWKVRKKRDVSITNHFKQYPKSNEKSSVSESCPTQLMVSILRCVFSTTLSIPASQKLWKNHQRTTISLPPKITKPACCISNTVSWSSHANMSSTAHCEAPCPLAFFHEGPTQLTVCFLRSIFSQIVDMSHHSPVATVSSLFPDAVFWDKWARNSTSSVPVFFVQIFYQVTEGNRFRKGMFFPSFHA